MIDLEVYRLAGSALVSGRDLYGNLGAPQGLVFTYPPFAALVLAPFAAVSLSAASAVATVANALLLLAVARQSMALTGTCQTATATGGALLTALAVWTEPVYTTLGNGQVNLAVLALVLGDFTTWRSSRWSGVGVGVAGGLKITPLLFVAYLLLTRRLRAAAVAAVAFAATVCLGSVVGPASSARFWTRYLFDTGRVGDVAKVANQSLAGAVSRLLRVQHSFPVVSSVCLMVLVALVVVAAWVHGRIGERWGVAVCAVASLLGSPISWTHHWVWCVPVMALLWREGLTLLLAVPVFWTFVVLAVPRIAPPGWTHSLVSIVLTDWYVLFGLAFVGVAVAHAGTGRRSARRGRRLYMSGRPSLVELWQMARRGDDARGDDHVGDLVDAPGRHRFRPGTRVTARHNLGRVFRAPVARGTHGTVVAWRADDTVIVDFDNGRRLALDPNDVVATSY